ncbi:MAG: ABC transporter ATP-binding protein [Alphaproteobacteria bacterium]|uniref:ABC transporter ATP-binding protein n=1 Tax=Candidatus Nitrobium versatile TaxID=2884831 RepID=A0A953J5L8_9BACT|nr:ABC transporter ATP-binding protein [Candidatus Nitrobium versatile]
MIQIRDIWKVYDVGDQKIEALRSVTLEIERGSFVSIVGHSGSGKTTLLSVLGGLTKPTRGSVLIEGIDIWGLDDKELSSFRNEKIGFIFQFASLLPTLRVIDNVSLPIIFSSRMNGRGRRDVYAYAGEILSTLGLSHKLNAFPSELSGGQQRRVAIARAFINRPSIIVADEPTGDLDAQNEAEVMEFFSRVNEQEKTTFLLVTHNLDLAKMTDRVFHMRDGVLLD